AACTAAAASRRATVGGEMAKTLLADDTRRAAEIGAHVAYGLGAIDAAAEVVRGIRIASCGTVGRRPDTAGDVVAEIARLRLCWRIDDRAALRALPCALARLRPVRVGLVAPDLPRFILAPELRCGVGRAWRA